MHKSIRVSLVGFGAIGRAVYEKVRQDSQIQIAQIVVGPSGVTKAEAYFEARSWQAPPIAASLECACDWVLECAGHNALIEHVVPALRRGTPCAILSIGALAQGGIQEALEHAALDGTSRVHLLAGAIGAVDALAAARYAGLASVVYTGRKPPASWKGTIAEQQYDLDQIAEPTVLLDTSAREAARLYPKNANVAATISLAGLGLDQTRATLIADPTIDENIHEVNAKGTFGELHLRIAGKPLPENPKTSALTVLSAVRFLHQQTQELVI